jgi:hypothetical protein
MTRYLALRWLCWAMAWDVLAYCSRNPWRILVALPLFLVSAGCVCLLPVARWEATLTWNLHELWLAVEDGVVRKPPTWLAPRLDPASYEARGRP